MINLTKEENAESRRIRFYKNLKPDITTILMGDPNNKFDGIAYFGYEAKFSDIRLVESTPVGGSKKEVVLEQGGNEVLKVYEEGEKVTIISINGGSWIRDIGIEAKRITDEARKKIAKNPDIIYI